MMSGTVLALTRHQRFYSLQCGLEGRTSAAGQGKPALRALSHSSVLASALLLFSVLTVFPTWNAFGAFHLAKSDCSREAKLKHPPSFESSLCLP